MHHPTDRMTHITVVEHWLEGDIADWVHDEGSIRCPNSPCANTHTSELRLAPVLNELIHQTDIATAIIITTTTTALIIIIIIIITTTTAIIIITTTTIIIIIIIMI